MEQTATRITSPHDDDDRITFFKSGLNFKTKSSVLICFSPKRIPCFHVQQTRRILNEENYNLIINELNIIQALNDGA